MMTVEEYIQKKNPSKVTLQLIEKLRSFSQEDEYVIGVLSNSAHEDDRKLIIDYIDYGKDVSYETVFLRSLELGQTRKIETNS